MRRTTERAANNAGDRVHAGIGASVGVQNTGTIPGGASNNTSVGISCGFDFTAADNSFYFPNVGFRCCR